MGGEGFDDGVACKYFVESGDSWKLLEGSPSGQTHVIYKSALSKIGVWAHPIDLHYATGSVSVCDQFCRALLALLQSTFLVSCLSYCVANHVAMLGVATDIGTSVET